ncbi:archaellin/type IV pilin N-terminal domain-containing protein [archaeon]
MKRGTSTDKRLQKKQPENPKGISPVVAVVLLIAIAVVAAVALYFWGAGLATKQSTPNTPIAITATPIGGGKILVANLGSEPIAGPLYLTSGSIACNYPIVGQEACNTSGTEGLIVTLWGPDVSQVVLQTAAITAGTPGCGDGVVDVGETCDDGNTDDGDCCDSSCTFDVITTACTDTTADDCLVSQCDGAGVCDQAAANEAAGTICIDDPSYPPGAKCDGAGTCDCVANEGANEASCGDTLDNDCDGDVDGADADCAGGAAVAPWAASLDSGRNEVGYGGGEGSLYTMGYQEDAGVLDWDVFVSSLNASDGSELWNSTFDCYDGPGNHDQGLEFVVLASGGFAIAGTCGTAGDQEAWALVLDSSGNEVRNATFDSTGDQDEFNAVIEDGTDLVFAGKNKTAINRGLIVKYDSSLVEQWNVTFNQSGASSWVSDIIEVSDGYVATGLSDNDLLIWKVDKATGAQIWNKTYDVGYNREDEGTAIVELGAGAGFAIGGYTTNNNPDNDVLIMKTDTSGVLTWNVTYDGGTEHDFGFGIVEVSDGYVAGGYEHNGADYDYFVWKVAKADGATEWTRAHDNDNDYGYSLQSVSAGGFIMSGQTRVGGVNDNIWVLRLNETGHAS